MNKEQIEAKAKEFLIKKFNINYDELPKGAKIITDNIIDCMASFALSLQPEGVIVKEDILNALKEIKFEYENMIKSYAETESDAIDTIDESQALYLVNEVIVKINPK